MAGDNVEDHDSEGEGDLENLAYRDYSDLRNGKHGAISNSKIVQHKVGADDERGERRDTVNANEDVY